VDTRVTYGERELLLVDTAGLRRRSQVSDAPEGLAVMMARRQIERASVAVLVIDAAAGVTSGDLAVAGTVWELGRACVAVCNKWDLLDEGRRAELEESWKRLDEVLATPRRVNTSAETGRGIEKILPQVVAAADDYRLQLGTSRLNELLRAAIERHHVPRVNGRPWKLFYASQVASGPPTFMVFANDVLPRTSTLRRYLENALRRELDLPGIPIRLVIRKR